MQSQKGVMSSLPESLALEHGSTSGDAGVVEEQLCCTNFIQNPPANANHETRNVRMWSMGESSSSHASSGHYQYGHNVTVNPSTFIGMKPSNYATSSSSSVETLPCKRKADELNISQSSSGIERPNILQMSAGGPSLRQSVLENPTPSITMPFDQIIPRLGSGTGVSSDNSTMENNHRNVRIRMNNSRQQDHLPASNNNISNNELLNFSAMGPSLGFNPVATRGDSSSRHEAQPMLQVPALSRNLHSSSRSRSSSSRANRPIFVGSGDYLRTTTNISDHSLFVQPHDIRNTAQTATNLDLNSTSGPTLLSSTSDPMPNLGPRRGSSLYSSRRQTELLRRALLSSSAGGGGGHPSNLFSRVPLPVGTLASSSQESGTPPVIAIAGHRPHNHLPRLRTSDRQLDGAFGFPYLSRRGRQMSEIRNVLDRIRRGEGLRFEDIMILDQSVFYGMADIYDRHRDMRLDIDNMSYEELLALEERIGNVNTGLTEENIHKNLKQKTYASVAGQSDDEPCCICQEEYKNGDDLGALYCGHEFHMSCIKQWLLQKNSCPVCKSAASK